jgi:hypothetical protein
MVLLLVVPVAMPLSGPLSRTNLTLSRAALAA